MITIATNLTDDSTNVNVNSLEDLMRFVKFAGGENEVYIYVSCFCEWQTVSEYSQSNDLINLF